MYPQIGPKLIYEHPYYVGINPRIGKRQNLASYNGSSGGLAIPSLSILATRVQAVNVILANWLVPLKTLNLEQTML